MSLTLIAALIVALPVLALATAGIYATMRAIPDSVAGLYRMHIYAPPAALFIGFACFILMIAPLAGIRPADTLNMSISAGLAVVFAVVGWISIKRNGYATFNR
ncbi:MAG: hypothetical protein IAF58_06845 [Leptolyngbya sp.]|nr:hypothetical protein [Candidatus Melainabacteria bacterium]